MKNPFRIALFVAFVLLLGWGALPARADGIVVPCPPPIDGQPPRPCPTPQSCPPGARCMPVNPRLAIKYHRVTVTIDNQIATTHVDQVFLNDSAIDLEGLYIFPLPADAAVSDFAMWVDGKRLELSAPDSYTFVVTAPATDALILSHVSNIRILPRHVLEPAYRAGRFA